MFHQYTALEGLKVGKNNQNLYKMILHYKLS